MAIPGLMRARGAAQAASALGSLRVVNSAELSFAITCGLGFYSPDLPTLGDSAAGKHRRILPDEMSGGFTFIKSGYNFSLAGTPLGGAPATCNGLAAGLASPGYAVVADPLDPTGQRVTVLRHELGRRDLPAHRHALVRRCPRPAARRRARRFSKQAESRSTVQHGARSPLLRISVLEHPPRVSHPALFWYR